MAHDLMNFYNLDPDENLDESLRLALMFKDELQEAVHAYMEMLHMSIDTSRPSPEEVNEIVQEAINAALVTGMRAYRSWILSQGINVYEVEASSGKDIPPHFFHPNARWPL